MPLNNLSITVLVGALSVAVNLLLGLVVYINDRKSLTSQIFGALNIILAFYLISNILGTLRTEYEEKLFWVRLVMVSAVLLGTIFHYFIRVFPARSLKLSIFEKIFSPAVTIAVVFLSLTQYVFSGLIIVDPAGVPTPIIKPGIFIFGIVVFTYTLSGIYLLIRKFINSEGLVKNQIRFLLIGTIGMFGAFLLLNFVAVVALETTFFINFTPLYISIFIIFAAYAILKHHLFNVKVVATELLTFALWILLLIRLLAARDTYDIIIGVILFTGALALGILLIRSVLQEVKIREQVQKLAIDLDLANHDLKRLDEAKTDFISIASHQLRTPLSIIKGYISMIQEGTFGKVEEKLADPLHKVYVSNERLINLVSDLLDLSRMERGKMQFEFAPIRLGDVVETLVNDFKIVAKSKKMRFEWKRGEANDLIQGDFNKLRQIILNFIDNAFKYTPSGTVTVSLEEEGGNIKLLVSDTGPGLTQEEEHALFQKFSRGKEQGRVHTEGLGLGLYVAKLIAEAHGGSLGVSSPGKGKGSTFYLTIPRFIEPHPTPSTEFIENI